MDIMSTAEFETRLTVLYEEPVWIGVSEKVENGKLTAAKHTFGAEPSMEEKQRRFELKQQKKRDKHRGK